MTKKNIFLIVCALLLAGLSFYLNRDRFRSQSIQIGERWMEPRAGMLRRGQNAAKPPAKVLMFLFDRKVQLNSVKVIPLASLQTNKYARAIWELTTDSNSIPVKDIIYGQPIRGMKPAVKGAIADPLEPGANYRLVIQAGPEKLQYDFSGPQATH